MSAPVFPTSFAQQRVWFLDQLVPNSPAYNIPLAIRLHGPLDVVALRRALDILVERHEALRTTFRAVDAQPVQVIGPARAVELPVSDLSGLPAEEAVRLTKAEVCRPFDLGSDLMLRGRLLRFSATEHTLLLTVQHIASDGWSVGVLCRELGAAYDALCAGRACELPELPIQYADYAVWQRNWLQGAELERLLGYWRKQLAGAPALLELPTDRPRPAVQSYAGEVEMQIIPKPVVAGLRELSRREGVSEFMTWLAVFQVLLHRVLGQDDMVVGTPMAARDRAEGQNVVGYFVNALLLRGNLAGNPTFRELLGRVRETALAAYAYQDVPFEKLLEELQPERNLSYSPLCQVNFALQNMPMEAPKMAGLTTSLEVLPTGTAKFDLTLTLSERADGLRATVEYSTDLFERATMARFLAHYRTLLESALANPEQRIGHLRLLTDDERRQLLTVSSTPVRECCVDELVADQAARTPQRIAVVSGHHQLTYRQLNEQADRLAARLSALGVGPGVLAAVYVERSVDMVVALLGIWKAGGVYVPLDTTYPPDRITLMLGDTQPRVVVTQRALQTKLPATGAQVVLLDEPAVATAPVSRTRRATDIAYVVYTSGSTGRPKGVPIAHRSVVNFLTSMQREPGLTADDVVLALTVSSFDPMVLELWLPLITGAQVVIARRELAADGAKLAEFLDDHGVTLMQATPVTYWALLQAGWRGNRRLKILCGSEAWPVELANELHPRCGSLWNMYGPTETTVWSSACRIHPGEPVLIAPPIENLRYYVLDEHRHLVPPGVTGEICIGGVGLSPGYLNRPELTAERFIPDPFSEQPGARLYRSGDLARRLADGRFEFAGRADYQIKIRGYRIEPGEVEVVLRQHPGVRDVVVVAREAEPGEKQLVAYVVGTAAGDELRRHALRQLPEFMVPTALVFLQALPLTPSGKVNRQALPAPERTRSELPGGFVAPRDPLEQQLTKLWQKLFGIEPVGVRDNFFELGGHSLLAIRLLAQVRKLTGTELPLVTLFQAPTIEQLAGILRQQGWESPWASLVPIKPGGSKPPFYCVHGVGGSILEYLDLAKYLDDDQPFYGLQAIGLDGKRPVENLTVEQMAARYLGEIRAFQSRGPYYLGGSSFGGLVAYEMAQQLRAAGEEVGLLALFDTKGPGYPRLLPTTTAWRWKLEWWRDRLALHWENFWASPGRAKVAYARERAHRWHRQIRWKRQRLWDRWRERCWPEAIRQARIVGYRAATAYQPQPYAGRVTLFRATEQPHGIYEERTLGWGPLVNAGLEVCDTPGHHGAIVREPRSRVLAEQLQEALARAWERAEVEGNEQSKSAAEVIVAQKSNGTGNSRGGQSPPVDSDSLLAAQFRS